MALTKPVTQLFDAVTVAGNSFSDKSIGIDLTDAIDLSVGYRLTFNAASTSAGVSIYMYADPSASTLDFSIGQYDATVDKCDIDGSGNHVGHTVASSYRMDHSPKYVKFWLRNHDSVSVTNFSVWVTVQKP